MKNNNIKKMFSAFAVLAISVTTAAATLTFTGCGDKSNYVENQNTGVQEDGSVKISTAAGTVVSRSSGTTYYVGPDAEFGNTSNDGSMEHPHNIGELLGNEKTNLKAGDTVYVLPGVYHLSTRVRILVSGEYNNYIRIVNAALESASGYTGTEKTCILDFSETPFDSNGRGVQIDGDYFHWYGVDICGAGDNGLYIGGSYNTVEYSEFYNNRDTGLQLGRSYSEYEDIDRWPSYNLVKNCTSHNNYDNETYGENADGFAAKLTVGYGNVFDGCIAYRNSDDGWDLYAKVDSGNIGTVIIYNCVAYENGYLEYTRDECNAYFPTYDHDVYDAAETSTNPYMTRDGDGNGFKLGGSIMEGDVIMYNCLSFNNRMHGVTDNSNPGYLKIEGVTSYNNSAAIGMDGKVMATANVDTHSNIDVSRQTYSYNTINNILSVADEIAVSIDTDNYRGTAADSLLYAGTKTNVVKGSTEVDTKNAGGLTYTSQVDALNSSEIFKQLPVVKNGDEYTYNLDGSRDSMLVENDSITSVLLDGRAHLIYRNEDESVNMGDILAQTSAGEELIQSYLGSGVKIGSYLNEDSWDKYTHFYQEDLINQNASSQAQAIVERVKEALTINCDENAVYQDIEVPNKMLGASIKWSTTDDDYLVVLDEDVDVSVSLTEYIMVQVWRDSTEDKHVTLKATITYDGATAEKTYNLTLKKGDPAIGDIYTVDMNGVKVEEGGTYIVDQYSIYPEPTVNVKNGLYWDSEKLLKTSEYDVATTYMYQTDSNSHAVQVKDFTPSVAGVYTVTKNVSLKGDSKTHSMTYRIYVASASAAVDFVGNANVSVYQDGYKITGEPSSATGTIYAVSSATQLTDLTKDNIKTYNGVVSHDFRATSLSFEFANANSGAYYIYYALANSNGEITSQVYEVKINQVNISNVADFQKMAGGTKIGDEEPSQTIYTLTQDLDFAGVDYAANGKSSFTGVFNGLGHTLSNITADHHVIYKVSNGTIMNVKFDNIKISSSETKTGIVSESTGGYFYNIAITNVQIDSSAARAAVLIGQVGGSPSYELHISQVSIVNELGSEYNVSSKSNRAGGLISFVQSYNNGIYIDNCYVYTDIFAQSGEAGGMVGSWEDMENDKLTISQCYYAGELKTTVAPGSSRLGGMLGYHKGGAGVLVITRCISLATLHIQGELRDASVKNASCIVGNFSTSGDATVTKCIAVLEEYNTDFDVEVFTETNLKRHGEYISGADYLALDTQTRWSIVESDGSNSRELYAAPYVTLNFLGNWD